MIFSAFVSAILGFSSIENVTDGNIAVLEKRLSGRSMCTYISGCFQCHCTLRIVNITKRSGKEPSMVIYTITKVCVWKSLTILIFVIFYVSYSIESQPQAIPRVNAVQCYFIIAYKQHYLIITYANSTITSYFTYIEYTRLCRVSLRYKMSAGDFPRRKFCIVFLEGNSLSFCIQQRHST